MARCCFVAFAVVSLAGAANAAFAQVCQPHWEPGAAVPPDGGVHALAAFGDGTAVSIVAGGRFSSIGGVPASLIARWDGQSWSPLGSGIPSQFNSHGYNGCCANVHSIIPGASASSLTIGGNFIDAGGQTVESIAGFSGNSWFSLAGGMSRLGCADCAVVVYAVAQSGPPGIGPLYVGGAFDLAGSGAAANVARWDGQTWAALGSGIGSAPGDPFPAVVMALTFYQGSLYAAGTFTLAGSIETRCIARWDGAAWNDVGGGIGIPPGGRSPSVTAMAVYDDGGGPSLYVAGIIDLAGGVPVRNIAKWNGSVWSDVGGGLGSGVNDRVWTLATFNDGSGPALYAGGEFADAGGGPASNIARWNGSAWSPFGAGVDGPVHAMAPLSIRSELYVGGWFNAAGSVSAPYLAKWVGCRTCYANCDESTATPILNINDFVCFQSKFAAGESYANCDGSTSPPTLNIGDFICFLNRFAAGCD